MVVIVESVRVSGRASSRLRLGSLNGRYYELVTVVSERRKGRRSSAGGRMVAEIA